MDVEQRAEEFRADFDRLSAEIGKVIVGIKETVEGVLTGLFAGGIACSKGYRVWVRRC